MPKTKKRSFDPAKLAKTLSKAGPLIQGVLTALELFKPTKPYAKVAKALTLVSPEHNGVAVRTDVKKKMIVLRKAIDELEAEAPAPKSVDARKLSKMKRQLSAFTAVLLLLED